MSSNSSSSTAAAPGVTRAGTGRRISPGVYVMARRLQMSGLASLGAHQFVVIVLPKAGSVAHERDVNGHRVIVLGAYNVGGRLQATANAPSDLNALQNFIAGGGGIDYDQVRIGSASIETVARNLVRGFQHYNVYELGHPIPYPDSGGLTWRGMTSSTTYNSNSWAQSLIEHVVGAGRVREDYAGIDLLHGHRIPARYFH